MKKIAALCILLTGLLSSTPAALAAAAKESPLKIGIIDTQKIVRIIKLYDAK